MTEITARRPKENVPEREASFEARRMEILHKAALAFAEDGYHQTSVNQLAERLGVSKPVLYYYAKNKDDLLFQCGEIARAELRQAMNGANRTQLSGMGRLRRFFSAYAEIMCGDFGRCLALVDPKALSPVTRRKDTSNRRETEEAVVQMILEGQADGSVAQCNATLATRALFGAFNGVPRWFQRGGEFSSAEVADAYLDLFVSGMGRNSRR